MSKRPTESVAVGGVPRADLLPLEIRREHNGRRIRRRMLWGVVAVILVVFVGTGVSFYFALSSQLALLAAAERTNGLLVEQQKYTEVRVVQGELADVEAAQRVGASTEIDWKAYLDAVEASLPAGVDIVAVSIDAATPLVDYAQPSAPLQGMRVASLTFSAVTPTLPDTDAWLVALGGLPGFTDANLDSMTIEENGQYKASISMHIGEDAWSERFVPEEEKTDDETTDDENGVPAAEAD